MVGLAQIYLDNNATTRPTAGVIEVMSRHFAESYANPGSRHAAGRPARQVLEDSRELIAEILGADPKEVIFTSGGTESINMAIRGLIGEEPGTIALTAGEHPATVETCEDLVRYGWKLVTLDVDHEGLLVPGQVDGLPWEELKLVTVILAHNETGVIQDFSVLADRCRREGVPFHVDAVQGVGKIPVRFHELGVSALSLGAHKFYGPRGIGALVLREGLALKPFLFGGHQEGERRPGTEPVALIAGMAKALEEFHAEGSAREERLRDLRDRLQGGLEAGCGSVVVNGSQEHRLSNTLNIAFPGLEGDPLLIALDLAGIACSLGSTCASGSSEPAPALAAMGCREEVLRCSVRFSVGIHNTVEEIEEAVARICEVVGSLRESQTASVS